MPSASGRPNPRPTAPSPDALPGERLGEVMRQARRGRFTLAQLSERAGVSANLIWLIEHGRGNPSLNTLAAIADALGIPLPVLVAAAVNPGQTAPPDAANGAQPVAGTVLEGPETGGSAAPGWRAHVPTGAPEPPVVAVPVPGEPAVWSLMLHRGNEVHLRVIEGSLELQLHDRTPIAPTPDGGEARLAIDLHVGPQPVRLLSAWTEEDPARELPDAEPTSHLASGDAAGPGGH